MAVYIVHYKEDLAEKVYVTNSEGKAKKKHRDLWMNDEIEVEAPADAITKHMPKTQGDYIKLLNGEYGVEEVEPEPVP